MIRRSNPHPDTLQVISGFINLIMGCTSLESSWIASKIVWITPAYSVVQRYRSIIGHLISPVICHILDLTFVTFDGLLFLHPSFEIFPKK